MKGLYDRLPVRRTRVIEINSHEQIIHDMAVNRIPIKIYVLLIDEYVDDWHEIVTAVVYYFDLDCLEFYSAFCFVF